jgi:HAL2 family 3'(2'),5'-bisphosphate nucleotidase
MVMSDISALSDATFGSPAGALSLDPLIRRRLAAALDAVNAAAAVCRRVQERTSLTAHAKTDASPVTIADFASQAIVVRTLRRALSAIILVAEEDPAVVAALGEAYVESIAAALCDVWPDATPAEVRGAIAGGAGTPAPSGFWTLDPVDGTKGFLRNQQYAIALAYIEQGRPTLAVLGCPNLPPDRLADPAAATGTGIMCFAVEGQGAWEVPPAHPSAVPRRLVLETAPHAGTVRICASIERAHGNPSGLAAIIDHAGVTSRTVCLDSQSKYAVVARGQADVYLRVPPSPEYVEWIWDHAAGSLIAAEAGCRVTDLAGQPLDFSRGRRLHANSGVLCARSEWYASLLRGARRAGIAGSRQPTEP